MRALLQKIRQLLRDRRFRRTWYRGVSSIAALVVFVTTYALVLPAITMESQAACGIEAHQHDDSCYEERLVCGQEESGGHHHDDSCYSVTQDLVCRQAEHQHGDSCYDADGNLICDIKEHIHGGECYQEKRELTCGLEESEGHTHTEACYEKVLVCGREAHIHSRECYKENSSAVTASTGDSSSGTIVGTDDSEDAVGRGDRDPVTTDPSGNSDAKNEGNASETGNGINTENISGGLVPDLESIDFRTVLIGKTGFYYFHGEDLSAEDVHTEDGQELPADSAEITDWKAVDGKTELAPADLLRAYFAYSIPASSLNETNQIARYRLPANLHLTDDQIMAINRNVSGVAAGLVDPSTGKVPDEDDDRYQMYLGAEAVEGTRTPDMPLRDGVQEYISAVVKAENVYENTLDESGRYVDAGGNITNGPGACIGQDLIFVFTPYTIEKNQTTYDQDGNPVTAGEKVTGWFACDFSIDQIDWVENETDLDNSTVDKTAEIVFAPENAEQKTKGISCTLTMVEKKADSSDNNDQAAEDGKTASDQTTAAGEKTDEAENAETAGKAGAEEKTAAYKAGILQADGDGYQITLAYTPDAQIPEGAKLKVQEILPDQEAYTDYYRAAVEKACEESDSTQEGNALTQALSGLKDLITGNADSGGSIYNRYHYARFFDIEILDGENKIEPAGQVFVNLKLQDVQEEEPDLKVVHFGTAGPEILETVDNAATEGIMADVPVADGARAKRGPAEDLFADSTLAGGVSEDSVSAGSVSEDSVDAGSMSADSMDADSMSAGSAAADEAAEKDAASEDAVTAIEDGPSGTELNFVTDAFSVYAVVSEYSNSGYNLGGKKFAIVNTENSEAVLGRTKTAANGKSYLEASAATVKENSGKNYVVGDEVTLWEFENVYNNVYSIKAPDGRYMNIGNGSATLSTNPQNITVSQSGGRLRLLADSGYALNAWNRSVSDGFRGGHWNDNAERFTLFTVNEIIQNQAEKISLKDLVAQSTPETPVDNVVIYTRILNRERDGYDYYAVSSDGSLVQIHDIGDQIGWTSLEASSDHLKWNLTVHRTGDEHNGYFDFQSQETGQFLIPTAEGGVKADDPEDTHDLGVNMQGWNNGTYGSTIERWDTGAHQYAGYAYDAVNNKIVPTRDDSQKIEFLFARVKEDTSGSDQLHAVPTLDGKTKGITVKMYDFDGTSLYWTSPARSREMSQVMGTNNKSLVSTNDPVTKVGYANRGLVTDFLYGKDKVPTATQTNRSLGDLFNADHFVSDASNIFVRQVYDETGYFSYDSSINYAYLDQPNNEFILYREVAAPEMEGADTPSGNKGNFFPFDSLEDLASQGKYFKDRVVQYDGDLQKMSPDNPLYGEKLYLIDSGGKNNYKSYFFGMTMEADFYQGPGGKDEKGNDIIYEFNGDDDMWLYIDGLLTLDIGGCHGAVSGTINFSTGEVKVNGSHNTVDTTLREIFRSNKILPDGTPWTEAGADQWFTGATFADYTKHSFKMFYMERGCYASNLKMTFNLLTIEPGSFVLEKKLPASIQSAYGDQKFAYQIYTMDGNGDPVLYMPPSGRYVTYEKTGDRVVPEGQTESDGFRTACEIDGQTFHNVYFLKPGESIVVPMENNEIRYYVREIGIDTDLYEEVWANDRELSIVPEDGTHIAQVSTEVVQTRGRVTYENIPKEVHNLRLQKLIEGPVRNPDDSFRFDVQLEDSKTGQLVPFNQGQYYIVKTENGVDQYYRYENGKLVQSGEPVAYRAGLSGSIDHIFPGYTILITGLLPGTDFKVTEDTSEREYPAGYEYVRTDVENAGEAQIEGSIGTILKKTSGGASDQDQDALVKITNTSDIKKDITVEKAWDGSMQPGTSTMVLYRVIGQKGNEDVGKPGSTIKVTIQADPAPVTTDGFITVHYTGTKKDGTADSGDFRLSNTDGWRRAFEFERGGQYSVSYTPDGTSVRTAEPDKTGSFTDSDTITLTTTTAAMQKVHYTFSVPSGDRPSKGYIDVTCNGVTKRADSSNDWSADFEVAQDTPVSYSAQPDGKFVTGVTLIPETATPADDSKAITMNPEVQDLTMTIPVSVDWSQSTTSVPSDAAVTFTFTGKGLEKTLTLPNGSSWNGSITLDRLDENGDLITYTVQSAVTTNDTGKTLKLEDVPAEISGSGSIIAKGTASSHGVVKVTVQRVQYYSDTGFNTLESLPVREFEPGSTIVVKVRRKNQSNLKVTYYTSDGKSGVIPQQDPGANDDTFYEKSFELTLPSSPGNYTVTIDDPWNGGVELVSVELKARSRMYTASALKRTVRSAPKKAAPTHIASPEQTFYDAQAGGSGDLPFTAIRFKDLPAGAEPVPTGEVSDVAVTLTGDKTYKWTNLSTIDANGNPIYYYVVERDARTRADEMTVTYEYTYREDGTIEKVKITNTAEGRIEPDTKELSFTKKWMDITGTAVITWPSGTAITVTIKQDEHEYAKYTIRSTDLVQGRQIAADGDTTGSKVKLAVTTCETSGYVFTLTGLPYGDDEPGYTYYVSENTVDGYLPPKYFGSDGDQVMGASQIGTGGTIRNDQIGYELPSTGGPGTHLFTFLGAILIAGAGLLLMRRQSFT